MKEFLVGSFCFILALAFTPVFAVFGAIVGVIAGGTKAIEQLWNVHMEKVHGDLMGR